MSVQGVLALLTSVVLFLVAAKSHGRQLRLERELEGHHQVTFGGRNHEWVEKLWQRDRRRFWILTPLFAILLCGVLARAKPGEQSDLWILFGLGVIFWAPVLSFVFLGVLSMARLRTAFADESKTGAGTLVGVERSAWIRSVVLGSIEWWAGALVLIAGIILLLIG